MVQFRHSLLLLVAALATAQTAWGQAAPTPGNCTPGRAEATLNVNNVAASLFNTGTLFFGNTTIDGTGYDVPQSSEFSPIFASGLWVGGRVGNELRVAGATYGNYNFWPGPLDETTGRPVNPTNCSAYDRIWSVSRSQILAYEGGGPAARDLAEWPAALGAPVIAAPDNGIDDDGDALIDEGTNELDDDGDGSIDERDEVELRTDGEYNLAGGDRPDIVADQALWWVMNDVGGPHTENATPVLGIEVQVLAFAFSRSDAIGSTTFYRYRVINKSGTDITQTYLSIFSDPDLGGSAGATQNYIGSVPELGLGYVYASDNTNPGYGTEPPPAVGYDFFQGPIVADGDDAGTDVDTLGTSSFSYFSNDINGGPTTDPDTGIERYNFMQGLWADATEMRSFGDGYGETQGEPTTFAFTGNPVTGQPWTELNPGAGLTPIAPNDRRFLLSTGPFTLANGVPQDIVFGIVYAEGTSNLDSITELFNADRLAQTAYDAGFELPPPPPAPDLCTDETGETATTGDDFGSGTCLEAVAQNGQITLVFGYPTSSPNYLGQYEVFDVFLAGQGSTDSTYNFEGFNIYRYPTSNFSAAQAELIATLDIENGIPPDNGIGYSFDITNLTNFSDYFYGVSAYAYNEESSPQFLESQVTEITIRPAGLTGGVEAQSVFGDSLGVTTVAQVGEGSVQARVVDPTRITGATYQVQFFNPLNTDNTENPAATTYRIVRFNADGTTQTVLDGQAFYDQNGRALPTGQNVAIIDGFSFDIVSPPVAFKTFVVTQNASGALTPFEYAAVSAVPPTATSFPNIPGFTVNPLNPTEGQQVGPAEWYINQGGAPTDATYATFFARVTRDTGSGPANAPAIRSNDYEWRFTGGSSIAYRAFTDGGFLTVPFELWDLGVTPDNAIDDVRLIPYMNPADTTSVDDFSLSRTDHAVNVGPNDPHTDWIYWFRPVDASPGQAGYNAYANGGTPNLDAVGEEIFARMVLVNVNGGPVGGTAPYNQALPEVGTIFRIVTTKANLPGDVFSINTAGAERTSPSDTDREAALDRITAVPNPYLGTSSYETGNLSSVIRFTNLPEEATTIRIFTVSGSLVQTLRKEGSSRSLDWNLQTSNNLPVASGMYLVHVDVEGVGERALKLGIVNRRTQITIF